MAILCSTKKPHFVQEDLKIVHYMIIVKTNPSALKPFSAKGNIETFANNTDSGESARNELAHLKSALFAF